MNNTITQSNLDSKAKSIGQKAANAVQKPAAFKDVNGKKVWVGGHIQAGQLNPTTTEAPQVTTPLPGAKDVVDKIVTKTADVTQPQQALTKEQLAKQNQAVEQAKTQYQQGVKTLENTLTNEPSRQEELQTLQEQQNVQPYANQVNALRPQVATLQGKVDALTAEENNQASLLDEKLASRAAIDQATNVMAREYDRKRAVLSAQLAAKSAMMKAYEGNLTTARGLVNDSLDAWTYDQQLKAQDLKTLMTTHKDWYDSLDKDYQRELANSRSKWEKETTRAKEDMRAKMNMLLDAANKGVDLGFSSEDLRGKTTEEVLKSYINKVAPEMKNDKLTDVKSLQKEYNDAISTGAIPADTTFKDFYAKMTHFGTESLDRVTKFSEEYDKLKAAGAIPAGMTKAEYLAKAAGIDFTSPTGGFPEAQNKWAKGVPLSGSELNLLKERIYSVDTIPQDLEDMLQKDFDKQFDTPRTNDELMNLMQLKYRLDQNVSSPQQTHDWLDSTLKFSGIPSEQISYVLRINDELLKQQTEAKKQKSRRFWTRIAHPKYQPVISPQAAREKMSSKTAGLTSPLVTGLNLAAKLGGALKSTYNKLWGNQ